MTIVLDMVALPFLWAAWLLSPHFRGEWRLHLQNIEDLVLMSNKVEQLGSANKRLLLRHRADVEAITALQRQLAQAEERLGEIAWIVGISPDMGKEEQYVPPPAVGVGQLGAGPSIPANFGSGNDVPVDDPTVLWPV